MQTPRWGNSHERAKLPTQPAGPWPRVSPAASKAASALVGGLRRIAQRDFPGWDGFGSRRRRRAGGHAVAPGPVCAGWFRGRRRLIQLRLAANMFDGMVAIETGKASPTGAIYNEIPDRVSDAAMFLGAGYAAGGQPPLGYRAAFWPSSWPTSAHQARWPGPSRIFAARWPSRSGPLS